MKKLFAAVIVIALLIAGFVAVTHKSSSKTTNTPTQSTQSQTQTNAPDQNKSQSTATGNITIKNMMFTPSQITVAKGGTVTWTNNDTVAHTVVDDLSNVGGPNSGEIAPGGTYSFTFTKTGSFQYHCSIHPSMRGTIVVQ